MRFAGDEVEAPILLLHALHFPATGFFMGDDMLDGDALDLRVRDHRSDLRRSTIRVGQHPDPTNVMDVANHAFPFLLQLGPASLQSAIQFVNPVLRLFQVRGERLGSVSSLLLFVQVGHTHALPMNQFAQADFKMLGNGLGLASALRGHFCQQRVKSSVNQETLDCVPVGQTIAGRRGRALGSEG